MKVNSANRSSASARGQSHGIVLGLPVPPVQQKWVVGHHHPRPKKLKGWLKIHLREGEIEELQAMADVFGMPFDWIVRRALRNAEEEMRSELGIDYGHLIALNKHQRIQLRGHLESLHDASRRVGFSPYN